MKAPDYPTAQSILGTDLITPEEVAKARPGIIYTDEQITALATSLPSADALQWCKDNGYALIPAPPTAMSWIDIRELKADWFRYRNDATDMRRDTTSFGWLAIKKSPIRNSANKTWWEQYQLLSEFERVPNVAEMAWFFTTFIGVRRERLFKCIPMKTSDMKTHGIPLYFRTSSRTSSGDHACIKSAIEGFSIATYVCDNLPYWSCGLWPARK